MSTSTARLHALNSSQFRQTLLERARANPQTAIEAVNDVIADLIDTGLAARQASWTLRGPGTGAVQNICAEIPSDLDTHINALGRRVAALGGVPHGTLQMVANTTSLQPYPAAEVSQGDQLHALAERLDQLGITIRDAILDCEGLSDPVSVHLLTLAATDVEDMQWQIERLAH